MEFIYTYTIKMEERKTPLNLTIYGINKNIYAGFWVRLSSSLIDLLIVFPIIFLTLYLNGLNKNAYYFTLIPHLIFTFWYHIYLVKKYGGTPGKLISGIRILKLDGTDVTWREAILRQIVTVIMTIFVSIVTLMAIAQADTEYFESLGWLKRQAYIMSLSPLLFSIYTWSSNLWTYSELFVLLFNKRKRALHDFIANTVIVKTSYIDKMRLVMNLNVNE